MYIHVCIGGIEALSWKWGGVWQWRKKNSLAKFWKLLHAFFHIFSMETRWRFQVRKLTTSLTIWCEYFRLRFWLCAGSWNCRQIAVSQRRSLWTTLFDTIMMSLISDLYYVKKAICIGRESNPATRVAGEYSTTEPPVLLWTDCAQAFQ